MAMMTSIFDSTLSPTNLQIALCATGEEDEELNEVVDPQTTSFSSSLSKIPRAAPAKRSGSNVPCRSSARPFNRSTILHPLPPGTNVKYIFHISSQEQQLGSDHVDVLSQSSSILLPSPGAKVDVTEQKHLPTTCVLDIFLHRWYTHSPLLPSRSIIAGFSYFRYIIRPCMRLISTTEAMKAQTLTVLVMPFCPCRFQNLTASPSDNFLSPSIPHLSTQFRCATAKPQQPVQIPAQDRGGPKFIFRHTASFPTHTPNTSCPCGVVGGTNYSYMSADRFYVEMGERSSSYRTHFFHLP